MPIRARLRSALPRLGETTPYHLLAASTSLALAILGVYAAFRIATVINAPASDWADATMGVALLLAELFLAIHGVGYFGSILKASLLEREVPPPQFVSHTTATVAVLVCSYNEDAEVLEETLSSILAMDYLAMKVYLLDDSTNAERRGAAEALAKRLGVTFVHRINRKGFKAGAINDLIPRLTEQYVAILDADQRPTAAWLKDMVPLLEADSAAAFVQVPQIYVNTEGLRVAVAAKYQQAIFFEYICEGKARSNAMFCCGSNVILRREALVAIKRVVNGRTQFFDEASVTEDFATSVRMHAQGWRSLYVNRPYVFGMGPETLPAYFTQQMRWAMGTLGVGLRLMLRFLRQPTMLRPAQWWEYTLSGTYYFVGWAYFVFMLAPLAWMAFDVRPLRAHAELYLLIFIPYMLFNLNVVFFGMRVRGYPILGVWLAMALTFCTFWTYMKAGIVALFGLRRAFGVTPKGVGGAVPLRQMGVELLMLTTNLLTAAAGLVFMMFEGPSLAYLINTFWAAYHAFVLSILFVYLNRRVTIPERRRVFTPASALGLDTYPVPQSIA